MIFGTLREIRRFLFLSHPKWTQVRRRRGHKELPLPRPSHNLHQLTNRMYRLRLLSRISTPGEWNKSVSILFTIAGKRVLVLTLLLLIQELMQSIQTFRTLAKELQSNRVGRKAVLPNGMITMVMEPSVLESLEQPITENM